MLQIPCQLSSLSLSLKECDVYPDSEGDLELGMDRWARLGDLKLSLNLPLRDWVSNKFLEGLRYLKNLDRLGLKLARIQSAQECLRTLHSSLAEIR